MRWCGSIYATPGASRCGPTSRFCFPRPAPYFLVLARTKHHLFSVLITTSNAPVHDTLVDYYGCPPDFAQLTTSVTGSSDVGYFRWFGALCYGRVAGVTPSAMVNGCLA